jgi:hypothetical protein
MSLDESTEKPRHLTGYCILARRSSEDLHACMAGGRTGEFEVGEISMGRRGDGTTSEARAGDDRGDPCEDHAEEAPRGPGPIFRGAEEEPTL